MVNPMHMVSIIAQNLIILGLQSEQRSMRRTQSQIQYVFINTSRKKTLFLTREMPRVKQRGANRQQYVSHPLKSDLISSSDSFDLNAIFAPTSFQIKKAIAFDASNALIAPSAMLQYKSIPSESTLQIPPKMDEPTSPRGRFAEYQPVRKIIRDAQVFQLLMQELQTLPKDVYEVEVAFEKVYVVVYPDNYREHLVTEGDKHHPHRMSNTESKYVIAINRCYPLRNSVRIHLLDGAVQPRVCDCRDFFEDIMGREYSYSIHFVDMLEQLIKLDEKLHSVNQQYLEMQRYGHFILGETFYYHELTEMFRSLTLLKDLSQKKSSIYVGVTETHLLIFKQLMDRPTNPHPHPIRHHSLMVKNEHEIESESEATYSKLRLISCAEMQCIDTIYYQQSEKVIRLVLKKYKSIKLYHEFEEIKKQYRFNKPEIFLRGVLKVITRFQPCEIKFQPAFLQKKRERRNSSFESPSKNEEESISFLISSADSLEEELKKQENPIQQKAKINLINKIYQKIIEFYSARANPYYLIFVNKLNHFYQTYYITPSKSNERVSNLAAK